MRAGALRVIPAVLELTAAVEEEARATVPAGRVVMDLNGDRPALAAAEGAVQAIRIPEGQAAFTAGPAEEAVPAAAGTIRMPPRGSLSFHILPGIKIPFEAIQLFPEIQ